MILAHAARISYNDFLCAVEREHCGTLSRNYRPAAGELAWVAECSLDGFLELETFPVWYILPGGEGRFEHWNAPTSRRIRFKDALERDDFRSECSRDRHPEVPSTSVTKVIVLHCTSCNHAAVIDGNHRLTQLALGLNPQNADRRVEVTGLSGSQWTESVPDMNKICACLAPE